MKEYIDKAVLIAMCKGIAACEWNKKVAPVSWADAYERFADEVEDFDAADVVERKRGEWVDTMCSNCGEVALLEELDGDIGRIAVYVYSNYCPNCGADMRGEKLCTE